MSRPPACRTSVHSCQSCRTLLLRTTPAGVTTCCSLSSGMLSSIMCYLMPLSSMFLFGAGWAASSSHGSMTPSPLSCTTLSGSAATRPMPPSRPWRTGSSATVRSVSSTSTPPFLNFVQGNLNVYDYNQNMKGFNDSIIDLGVDVPDCVLMNILRGLNKNYDHLLVIFTHTTPFPSFQRVHDDLCLEEI
jgi:hypothetical protein